MIDLTAIRIRYEALRDTFDERESRLFVGAEASAAGRGGIVAVSLATGVARSTIKRGMNDLDEPDIVGAKKARRPGGGPSR